MVRLVLNHRKLKACNTKKLADPVENVSCKLWCNNWNLGKEIVTLKGEKTRHILDRRLFSLRTTFCQTSNCEKMKMTHNEFMKSGGTVREESEINRQALPAFTCLAPTSTIRRVAFCQLEVKTESKEYIQICRASEKGVYLVVYTL